MTKIHSDLKYRRYHGFPLAPSPKRIRSLDILRGIGMLIVMLGHYLQSWFSDDARWLFAFLYYIFDILGPSLFIFCSGISFSLSYYSTFSKPNQRKYLLYRTIRTGFVLLLAFIMNVSISYSKYGWGALWVWFVLLTIGICRLLGELIIKFPAWISMLFATSFIGFSEIVRTNIVEGSILYKILMRDPPLNTPFPFFCFFFAGMVIGKGLWLYNFNKKNQGKSSNGNNWKSWENWIGNPKKLFIIGLILTAISVVFGFRPIYYDSGFNFINQLDSHPDWSVDAMPAFLSRSHPLWCVYSIGVSLIIFSLLIHKERINKPIYKITFSNPREYKYLGILGYYSLSIYIYHFIGMLLFPGMLNHITIWIPYFSCALLVWLGFYLWHKKLGGVGTFEYMITIIIFALELKIRNQKSKP